MFSPDPTRRVTNIKWGGIWVLSIGVSVLCRSYGGIIIDGSSRLTIGDGEGTPPLVLRATVDSGSGPGKNAHGTDHADYFKRSELNEGPLTIIDTRAGTEPTGWSFHSTYVSTLVLPTKENRLLSHKVPISCRMISRGERVESGGDETIAGSGASGTVDHYLIKAKTFDPLPWDDPSDPNYNPNEPHQKGNFSLGLSGEGWNLSPSGPVDGGPPPDVIMSDSADDTDAWVIDTIKHKIVSHNGTEVPQDP